MNIAIECLAASAEAACRVREQVFGREWRVTLPQLSKYLPERQLTVVARDTSTQEPVAALTVIETTGDTETFGRFGLSFSKEERTARYTQLAVLKPYRGMNLPIRLILTARQKFVVPRQLHYTWLLFDAEHAKHSSLCSLLGFAASRRKFLTEYGCSRVLTRDETTPQTASCDCRAQSLLQEVVCDGLTKGIGAGPLEARG